MARLQQFAVGLLLACAFPISSGGATASDYWMYVGNYTSLGGKGIYLFKFLTATGTAEPVGLAAGRLWEYSQDPHGDILQRIEAQIRVEWPDVKRIALGVQNPAFLAIHPSGRYFYSADDNEAGTVSAFEVDTVTGKAMLSKKPSGGGYACYLTVDQTGKNVLVANFGGSIAVLPIDASGRLGDATSVIKYQRFDARHSQMHSINLSPDNRFVIASDMGLDRLLVYRFNADSGTLTPNDPPFLQTELGAGARHLSFHPNGKFAYLISEMGSSITALSWDANRGTFKIIQTVSALPKDFGGDNASADILVHPSGRFLYGSNRGHNSIVVFAIDPANGSLTFVEHQSSLGRRPRGLRIDPSGKYLFAANVDSNNVVQFRIDLQTGRLTPTGVGLKAGSPASIRFVPIVER